MNQSLYTAASAVYSQQRNIDNISTNIANMSTNGYKKLRTDFKEALYGRIQNPVDNDNPDLNLQRGVGVSVYQTLRVFDQGALISSSSPLDIALDGEGFYTVLSPEGEVMYTRNPSFNVSMEEDANYIVDPNGYYLLDENGERIAMQGLPTALTVGTDGTTSYTIGDEAVVGQKIGVVTFSNAPGLEAVENGYFRTTANSGDPIQGMPEETGLRQFYTEQSNVDYAEEVTRIIRAQRAYQLASRAITTSDQMAQVANNIGQ